MFLLVRLPFGESGFGLGGVGMGSNGLLKEARERGAGLLLRYAGLALEETHQNYTFCVPLRQFTIKYEFSDMR